MAESKMVVAYVVVIVVSYAPAIWANGREVERRMNSSRGHGGVYFYELYRRAVVGCWTVFQNEG